MPPQPAAPHVSIIMANYNGARFIAAALRSCLAQTVQNIEIIVVDDASTDDSVARIQAIAATDARIRLAALTRNGGPAAARNHALDLVRGEWIAVVDSDDLIHPTRLERLLQAAQADGADIVADNMLEFQDDGAVQPQPLIPALTAPQTIDLAWYVQCGVMFRQRPGLGYLKPVMRAALVARLGIRYDLTLRIAEDYDLIARLLAGGAVFRLYPDLLYMYRKHGSSISHRLSRANMLSMRDAGRAFEASLPAPAPGLQAALRERDTSMELALQFDALVTALKQRQLGAALGIVLRHPRAGALLRLPVLARLRRLRGPATAIPTSTKGQICVLARQDALMAGNDRAGCLRALCQTLQQAGMAVHLVAPVPMRGTGWPIWRLAPGLTALAGLHVRGAWRIGGWVVSCSLVPQPPRIGADLPLTNADRLFIARHAGMAERLMLDGISMVDAITYALRPDAPSVVVLAEDDSFTTESSHAALARVNLIAVGRAERAAALRADLPGYRVALTMPGPAMASAGQPGSGASLLHVASNTAANVVGLRWFLDKVWPMIRAGAPDASLIVAGSVGSSITVLPAGVSLLQTGADLGAAYRDSAVVIFPRMVGTTRADTLIAALCQGKACVTTSAPLQDMAADVISALSRADTAEAFAIACLNLLLNQIYRAAQAQTAHAVGRSHFSAAACVAAILDSTVSAAALTPIGH